MSDVTATPANSPTYLMSYPRFIERALWLATEGSLGFYAWMTVLTALSLVGANAWATQVADGMIDTHMTDQVSWGLYIANFTFCVGLAAGGVMMVIPAYLYDDEEMHRVVIIGEAVAIAAIVMCILSVVDCKFDQQQIDWPCAEHITLQAKSSCVRTCGSNTGVCKSELCLWKLCGQPFLHDRSITVHLGDGAAQKGHMAGFVMFEFMQTVLQISTQLSVG